MKTVHFRPDLDLNERVKELRKICVTEVTKEYQRSLTDVEVDKDRFEFVEQSQTLANVKKNAKAAQASFNAEISSIQSILDEKMLRIETGKRKVNDALYGVPNYNSGLMEFYDRFGEMIESRKLTPDETTGQMFNNAGEASENLTDGVKGIGFDNSDIQDADYEEVKNENSTEISDEDQAEQPKKKGGRKTKAQKEAEKKASEEIQDDQEEEEAWPESEWDSENDRINPPGE